VSLYVQNTTVTTQQADASEVIATVNTAVRATMVARWNDMMPFVYVLHY